MATRTSSVLFVSKMSVRKLALVALLGLAAACGGSRDAHFVMSPVVITPGTQIGFKPASLSGSPQAPPDPIPAGRSLSADCHWLNGVCVPEAGRTPRQN